MWAVVERQIATAGAVSRAVMGIDKANSVVAYGEVRVHASGDASIQRTVVHDQAGDLRVCSVVMAFTEIR